MMTNAFYDRLHQQIAKKASDTAKAAQKNAAKDAQKAAAKVLKRSHKQQQQRYHSD